jgi:hypothetical protein
VINVTGCTEIPLGVFGGNNLDMQATDLPMGLSPDNGDCAFLPGSVFTRPSLHRLLTSGEGSQIVYATTYLRPDETVVQLTFDAAGRMFADGVQFGATRAGNRFFTCNAFGKTYIATSDGSFGADVPLQLTPEGFLDRVSQDGPGAPPTLSNQSLPAVALVTGSSSAAVAIVAMTPINPEQVQVGSGNQNEWNGGYQPPVYETYYTSLLIQTATAHGLVVNESVSIVGNSLYNSGSFYVTFVDSASFQFEVAFYSQSGAVGTGGTVTAVAALLVRNNNQVTATTATPHSLRSGYQVAINGVADASQSITKIVVNNETLPGVATITTPVDHEFVPGDVISIAGVTATTVGGSITAWVVSANSATVTMASNHGLTAGTSVLVEFGTLGLTPRIIDSVPSLNTFTFPIQWVDGDGTTGTVQLPWPVASGTQFTISATPTPTTFQIQFNFNDGTWTSGSIGFAWDGTFFVTATPSPTSFVYSQPGPNNSVQSGTGTATPVGQMSPGTHKCVCIFQTRTGYLTGPSIPVTLSAGGSQYPLAARIPIGPSNVIARILAFTGANGSNYFYLPIAPQLNGQIIGTSTVVNDNVTTSAVFDFSDEALFAGTAIDIPGNNLFNLQVLGPCLGFFNYASRLMAWGERNKIQQFLNMGFEGGYYADAPNNPLGWNVAGLDGTLTSGDYGQAWTATSATISQSAYQDRFGIAIIQPNTQYTLRQWVNGTSIVTISSVSTGFTTSATVSGVGAFAEAKFSVKTPVTIPADLIITISQDGTTTHDEIEIIYTLNPYILTAKTSYVNNPESFDGVTGILGPTADPHPVLGMEERKDVLCLLTSGPQGSLYETEDTPSGEPATWNIRHIAAECGLISVWGVAKFEDWFSWTSDTGLRIFDGSNVEKMSQEIQPWWNSLNPGAKQFTVLANDPYTRRVYVVAATGTETVTNEMYVLDYRDLNTSSLLANAGTLRIGYSGKVVTTDLTRKWSPWSMTMNYCGLLTLSSGEAVMAFCGGTGVSLADPANSSVYELAEGVIDGIDQDYGAFWFKSTYPTYFFISADDAQQKQLGVHRLQHDFLTMNCTGVGAVFVTPNLDRMGNTGKSTRALAVTEDLARDLEFGLQLAAERISYRVCCQPAGPQPAPANAPAGFRLSSMTLAVKTHAYSPIRGRNS